MKIALVIERMDPQRGGREVSTAQVAVALSRRGHEVTVLCQRSNWAEQGVRVLELGKRGLLRFGKMRNFISDAQEAVAGGAYDVVHAMLPMSGATVYQPRGGTIPGQVAASGRRWGLLGHLRTAVFEHLNLCRRELARLEASLVADERVLCLAISRMVMEEFAHFYGRTAKTRLTYNGVDIPAIDPDQWADWRQRLRFDLGVGQGDPVFITIATNFALKGVDEAIRAFAKWHNSHLRNIDPRLVVVGRDMAEGHQRLAGAGGVGRQVVFVPPTKEIHQWYAAADACILLSWYDPCSRTILEATRLGIPSITTRYNGAAEVLANGAGIVVDSPKDSRAIVAALDDLADPHRRAERSRACLEVADSLSVDRHVDELLHAYQEVLGKA